MIGAAGPGGSKFIVVDSADFDGTNDYMTRGADLTGIADGKTGILSYWIRLDGGDGSLQFALASAVSAGVIGAVRFTRGVANVFEVIGRDATTATVLFLKTSATYLAGAAWHHVLSSWDLLNNVSHLYVDDASDQVVTTRTNANIDYTQADWFVGESPSLGFKLNGCLAEFYFAPGQFLDFSVLANRRKFIASGRPVFLGTDGSLPTGTAPLIYQHLSDGEAVANFATNRGTGGNFTITGTLDAGSTSPSD
jgi:hypothetical protein